jgi:Protein of unknown function (DUF2933)
MARVIPYLALLACPLMMLRCMRGMRGMGQQHQAESKPEQPTADQRIAQLEQELADLRAAQRPAAPPASWVEPSADERGTGRAVRRS